MAEVVGYFTDVENVHVSEVGGSPLFIGDDFGDLLYTGRDRFVANILFPYINFRPEWTVISGTWVATSGHLVNTSASNTDVIEMVSEFTVGTWRLKRRLSSVNNNDVFNFMWIDADNHMVNYLMDSNRYYLYEMHGASGSTIISGSWTTDTGWHETRITRNSSGDYEIFIDAVSKGTVTDTNVTSSNKIRLGSGGNYTLSFDNLEVY